MQIPKFINKASFDPFLRTIDNKIPARSGKEQDIYKNRNILFAEDIEYEDQDPPYLGFSKTAGYSSSTWASDPSTTPKMMSDRKSKLSCDYTVDTVNTALARDATLRISTQSRHTVKTSYSEG